MAMTSSFVPGCAPNVGCQADVQASSRTSAGTAARAVAEPLADALLAPPLRGDAATATNADVTIVPAVRIRRALARRGAEEGVLLQSNMEKTSCGTRTRSG
jgi:hypothetical protein